MRAHGAVVIIIIASLFLVGACAVVLRAISQPKALGRVETCLRAVLGLFLDFSSSFVMKEEKTLRVEPLETPTLQMFGNSACFLRTGQLLQCRAHFWLTGSLDEWGHSASCPRSTCLSAPWPWALGLSAHLSLLSCL